jgi:hypothetical protein
MTVRAPRPAVAAIQMAVVDVVRNGRGRDDYDNPTHSSAAATTATTATRHAWPAGIHTISPVATVTSHSWGRLDAVQSDIIVDDLISGN